jgi:hypothetical protein
LSWEGINGWAGHLGKIPSRKQAITKLVRQFQSKYPGGILHFCYEAGPCGYWMYRLLSSLGSYGGLTVNRFQSS